MGGANLVPPETHDDGALAMSATATTAVGTPRLCP